MNGHFDPALTHSDKIVLQDLTNQILSERSLGEQTPAAPRSKDEATIKTLKDLNDPQNSAFEPTIVTSWDAEDFPVWLSKGYIKPYTTWASTIVRRPTDVVFLTHILLYLCTSVPSAVRLYLHFTWPHAIGHWLLQSYYCGAFTLMLHNHIHNNGLLQKRFATFDGLWPYILSPLMGHTWNSYYYHHVKHHHVENNGPGDLSSTIRYQRDELFDFLQYVTRFLLFTWIELPLYFFRKQRLTFAVKSALWEQASFLFIYILSRYNFRATVFVLMIPLIQMRIGMMVGNWGQHALVDEQDPDSDFRSSITLIDVPSNRHCFNDGYHTSHHLNPRRHWRDHPIAFIQGKADYAEGRALVFKDIDYIFMTVTLLRKDYAKLARCLVPIGDQVNMSPPEIEDMLRLKTKRFSEEDILRRFGKVC